MTAIAQKLMTVEEFVAWAANHPEKHWELFEGVPQMQQAQTWGHGNAKGRIYVALLNAIEKSGLGYFVAVDSIVVKTDALTAFEPDVVVFSKGMDAREIVASDPIIVVEVLSPSTARKDLTVKLSGYFNVRSVEHYLIVDWEEREFIHYRREGTAIARPVILSEGILELNPPGISLALADVFK